MPINKKFSFTRVNSKFFSDFSFLRAKKFRSNFLLVIQRMVMQVKFTKKCQEAMER